MYGAIFFSICLLFQLGGQDEASSYQAQSIKIALVDEDGGELAQGLKNYLSEVNDVKLVDNDKAKLQENLFYRNVEYIVHIPTDFFKSCIVNGKALEVTKVPGSYTSFYVDQQIDSYLNSAATYYAAGFSEAEAAWKASTMNQAEVNMIDISGTGGEVPAYAYYFRYIPYLFLGILCYVMGNILSAFRRGNLPERMEASAVPIRRQNMEGLLAAAVIGAGLWIISILLALALYGTKWLENGNGIYYMLNSILMLMVAMTISYLIGMIVKNLNALNGIINTLSLGMCFLCGVFVPLEYMGKGVKTVAKFLPVYWYENINDLLSQYKNISGSIRTEVLQALGIQCVFVIAIICVTMVCSARHQRS